MIRPQPLRTTSPWPFGYRIRLLLWSTVWSLCCYWTPKPLNKYRVLVLRLFGAHIDWSAFVHQRARIAHPWNLTMGPGTCLGDAAHAYNLAPITLCAGATVAQEAYLCTASHDFSIPSNPLIVAPITIEDNAFIGARSFVLPGLTVGTSAIVGACSVVTRNVLPYQTVAGNPARPIRPSA